MADDNLRKELKARVASAMTPREAAVDVMKELQARYGWLTDEGVLAAADILGLSALQVEELATFYEMIYRRPVGKRVVHVCDSISCWAMGGETMLAYLSKRLGVAPGETTGDGAFTILPCCCLGMCGDGPAMMIGETLHGRLTPDRIDEILDKERKALIPLS